MKRLSVLIASFAFVAAAQLSAAAATTVTVALNAQNGSRESGTATMTQIGNDVRVIIALTSATATAPRAANIRTGTCAKPGTIAYPLANVVNGASTTTLKGVTIYKLLSAAHAISVNESTANSAGFGACGNMSVVHITTE
jgi:hypothetical protein